MLDDSIPVGVVEEHPSAYDVLGTPCIEPLEVKVEGIGRRYGSSWGWIAQTKAMENIEDFVEDVCFRRSARSEKVVDLV